MRVVTTEKAFNCFIGAVNKNALSSTSGKLSGLKMAIKDNICMRGSPVTCASAILKDFCPEYSATVVDLLAQEGAQIVGKTNCDEFGMGSNNIHSHFGPVINPCSGQVPRSAGGSSGGSAAAVAADLSIGALATDTGGSTRLPAAYCGIVGFKPSYGSLSRYGVIAYADSLDCVGIMSKRVNTARTIFDVLNHHDPRDPTAASLEHRAQAHDLSKRCMGSKHIQPDLSSIRIGIPTEYFPVELESQVRNNFREVLDVLAAAGAELVPISLPSTRYALSAYYVISSAEASSNLARYNGFNYSVQYGQQHPAIQSFQRTRTSKFGAEVKRRLLLGTYALMAEAYDNYFLQARKVASAIQSEFDKAFIVPNVRQMQISQQDLDSSLNPNGVHLLLHPSAIRTAPTLGEIDSNPETSDAYEQDILTVPASLAGLPAISIPSGFGKDRMPLGISAVGQWGQDSMLLDVAELIECLLEPTSINQ